MLSFDQWDKAQLQEVEQQTDKNNGEPTAPENNEGPKALWDKLIEDHRVHFTNKFVESQLTESDKQFVVQFFENFKYSSQKTAGHIFETKIRAVTFQIAYFGKQQWAACIITNNTREVTELFTVTETKIQTMYQLFEKAIKQQSFKDILPVKTK